MADAGGSEAREADPVGRHSGPELLGLHVEPAACLLGFQTAKPKELLLVGELLTATVCESWASITQPLDFEAQRVETRE
jgi:hypothetical protein